MDKITNIQTKFFNKSFFNKNFFYKFLFLIILVLIPFALINAKFIIVLFTLTFIYAIAAIGLNILMGFAGQISIGHAAFMAIGAYTSALLNYHFKIGFIPSFLLAGIISGFLGLILGLPALRLKGFYLAITTMGFGIATTQIISSWESLTKGHSGLTQDIISSPDIFGLKVSGDLSNYLLVVSIFFIIYIISKNIEKSKYGRNFKAIRDTEVAAITSGINTTYYKLLAFIISAVFAGFAGSLYAHVLRYLNPINFGLDLSLNLLAMIIIGGIGSIEGAILGAFFLTIISQLFTRINFPPSILNGIAIVLIMLFLPQGLFSLYYKYKIFKFKKKNFNKSILKIKNGIIDFVKINNLNIEYIKRGKGNINILFIHGNTASALWWIRVINKFSPNKFTLWALTLPGFGNSDRVNIKKEEISIDYYSDFVKKFIEQVIFKKSDSINSNLNNINSNHNNKQKNNKQRIILIGHSLGGLISQYILINNPEIIKKLILVDSAPPESIKTPESFYSLIKSLTNNKQMIKQSMKNSLLKCEDYNFLEFAVEEALKMQDKLFMGNVYCLNKCNLKEFSEKQSIDLKSIDIPILILRGKYDIVINESMIDSTINFYKNTKYYRFENSSHSPFIEETDKFVYVITNFIQK